MGYGSIDLASLILQVINLDLYFKDFKNIDIINKLDMIVEQNEKIITLLEGRDNNGRNDKKNWRVYWKEK